MTECQRSGVAGIRSEVRKRQRLRTDGSSISSARKGRARRRHLAMGDASIAIRRPRRKVRDRASRLRAMRAEVTAALARWEPHDLAPERLMEVVARGFQAVVRMATMHPRTASDTKNGAKRRYVLPFARAMAETSWRDRHPAIIRTKMQTS